MICVPNSVLCHIPLDRPRDAVSLGVASGYFSNELQRAQRNGLLVPPKGGVQDKKTVAELSYRVDLRKGAYFIQPNLQYSAKPAAPAASRTPQSSARISVFSSNQTTKVVKILTSRI